MGDFTRSIDVYDSPRPREDEGIPEKLRPDKPCADCGSEDTECIYYEGGGSIIGTWSESEHLCRECGKYTVYQEEYES